MSKWRCSLATAVGIMLGCISWFMPVRSNADFVFEIIERTPGDSIEVGASVIFDVTLAMAPGFASVNNLAGVSFFVGLGDPAGWGSPHPAGTLRSGTNDSTHPLAAGRQYLFTPSEGGGFLNDDADFLAFSVSTISERTVTTTPAFLGSFVLDTVGGTAGDYTLMFAASEFGLQDPASNFLPGTYTGQSFSFRTITAIPEPNSWLVAALALGTTARFRSRFSRVFS